MIARLWRARATASNAAAYRRHFEDNVRPALRRLPGHAGATLMLRDSGERVEILVMSLWDSTDAIRSFAGDDLERAVVEPEAQAVLTSFDIRARHYVIAAPEYGLPASAGQLPMAVERGAPLGARTFLSAHALFKRSQEADRNVRGPERPRDRACENTCGSVFRMFFLDMKYVLCYFSTFDIPGVDGDA